MTLETTIATTLAGKRALVTGASRGIGAAIAVELAAAGADVAVTYERSAERAEATRLAIAGKGRRGFTIQADSADAQAVKRSVAEAAEALGGLDILVNNAGIARAGLLVETALGDIDAMLDVNLRSVLLASQAAIPHLGAGGRIISIGSNLAERVAFPGVAIYAATKSALTAFTRGLARELGPSGITVNLVHPGSTDTDMNPGDGAGADAQGALTALGGYGRPADIAAAVVFLAGPAAGRITGTSILVDGGANA